MNPFERCGQSLIWRGRGETLMLTPWGPDSLRVRAALVQEIADPRWALLEPVPTEDVDMTSTE